MVFALFASTGFLLIVIVALFAGDTVPSEASWSSLRYLLAAPVRRERLLRQKLIVAALSSIAALVFLPAWTLLVGGIAYGWGPYVGPTGDQIGWPRSPAGWLIIVGYLLIELTVVAAFAFMLGVLDRRAAGRGRRRGAADDPVGHPGLDHRARRDPAGPARALRVRLGRRAGPDGRLLGHGHRRAVVDRLRHRADRLAVWHFLRKDITS